MIVKRGESLAISALLLILVGLPVAFLGYQFLLRPALADVRTIDIVAAAPEVGGFQPDGIRVPAGETVHLRFSVPDVTHGIAIGPGLDLDLGHVDPGEVREVEVTFDQPGRYTFYCNTWCSPNHWRMRGTITVVGDGPISVDAPEPPLYLQLEIDLDAERELPNLPLDGQPSSERGASLGLVLPMQLEGAVLGNPLPLSQSLVLVWPQLTGLIATTILLFALSYVLFQRQEIRA